MMKRAAPPPEDQFFDDAVSIASSKRSGHVTMTKEEEEKIAEAESRAVLCFKVLVILVITVSALAVALFVFYFLSDSEDDEFKSQFESDSAQLFGAVGKQLDSILGSTDSFIVNLLAHVSYSNSTYPFITMPNFPVQAIKLRTLSKAIQFSVSFFVEQEQRLEWEQFTQENNGWIDDGIAAQREYNDIFGSGPVEYIAPPFIIGAGVEFKPVEEATDYQNNYLPTWLASPTVALNAANMFDLWQSPLHAAAITRLLENQKVVVSTNYGVDPENFVDNGINTWANRFPVAAEYPNEPKAAVMYPIIAGSEDTVEIETSPQNRVVGLLMFHLLWRELFAEALAQSSVGVIAVMSHPCSGGQSITYQIDGLTTTYLGAGDLHDPKYDSMVQSFTLSELLGEEGLYTGLRLDEEFCPRTLHVYPSSAMEDEFKTDGPIIYAVSAVCIFVFTALVFGGYDLLVARRQGIVLRKALASGAIVSSLFPEKVREQLYQEKVEVPQKEPIFINRKKKSMVDTSSDKKSRPIADVFNETTIYFADLAGFTAWSANRKPTEVFELLETLYGAFDAIASRRGVFKVETIGDCYVAATGIPEPQDDHAVIMVKFARDCMTRMSQLTNELVDVLGADTADLQMRVGLHSGSTTAGVLRGDKGRFQLFGDTVNTASRIESNGVKGQIHVSQATADALMAKGKSHWLTAREDKIVAKGKGEMQTYFVTIRSENTAGLSDDEEPDFEETNITQPVSDTSVSSARARKRMIEDSFNSAQE